MLQWGLRGDMMAQKKKAVKKPKAKKAVRKAQAGKPAVKRLRRSNDNKMISGVCGGIGEYLGIDPNIVRLIWIAASLLGGPWSIIASAIIYAIAAIVIPKK